MDYPTYGMVSDIRKLFFMMKRKTCVFSLERNSLFKLIIILTIILTTLYLLMNSHKSLRRYG